METAAEDLLYFVDVAVDGMVSIVEDLGDDLANKAPGIPGANSPFVILTHCIGVMAFWGTEVAAGQPVSRDRAAEFVATGRVTELAEKAKAAKAQLREVLVGLALGDDARIQPKRDFGPDRPRFKVATAITHILEELAQHHGQMEISRDLLKAEAKA